MALIKCAECGNDVSNKSASCPKCGNPIQPQRIMTTQETAKKFKGQQLAAMGICSLGAVLMVAGGDASLFGAGFMLTGLVLFLGARMRAWWHHG